jgi:DNA-binding MarR family transcriptional regulator
VATAGTDVAVAFGLLLRRTTRARLYGRLTDGLHATLDESTYPVISGLARLGPRSAAQLAAEIGVDRSVVSRHASRLVDAGLLKREPDPSDRRAVLLTLTGSGRTVVREMRRRLAVAFDSYFASWSPDEARTFATGLRRFAEEGPFGTVGTDAEP